ncbi:hypothetical protein ROZALSC1DRAFT_24637 [Rozella allomycis CSF55]|uniref:Uncharacterized protein n=1 Tax=Rozella allomycis (strain CSF55) TaxID=988480 RepID=A0A4P9YD36_ROZAC|nr:hypothetical protein ROZALSC1DRAFT_24637 [Rozella allomycis CSF55]
MGTHVTLNGSRLTKIKQRNGTLRNPHRAKALEDETRSNRKDTLHADFERHVGYPLATSPHLNVLKWWTENSFKFPYLFKIVPYVLSFYAKSVPSILVDYVVGVDALFAFGCGDVGSDMGGVKNMSATQEYCAYGGNQWCAIVSSGFDKYTLLVGQSTSTCINVPCFDEQWLFSTTRVVYQYLVRYVTHFYHATQPINECAHIHYSNKLNRGGNFFPAPFLLPCSREQIRILTRQIPPGVQIKMDSKHTENLDLATNKIYPYIPTIRHIPNHITQYT